MSNQVELTQEEEQGLIFIDAQTKEGLPWTVDDVPLAVMKSLAEKGLIKMPPT